MLAIRTYEAMIYLGPLLAAMVAWTLWRQKARPLVPTLIYAATALCFLGGMWVAVQSVVHPWSESHLNETYDTAKNFWQNMQFDLALGSALIVIAWGLLKPGDLAGPRPYFWAAIPIAILALSPLLGLTDTLVRPLAKSQYVARSAAGLVIVGMVIFIWTYRSGAAERLKALSALSSPVVARRFLALACLMVLAELPSDLFLTHTWVAYLDALRTTVRTHHGVVAFEDTPLSRPPHILLVENWALSSQSLAVRTKPGDGVIAPPRGFSDWLPFPADDPPNLGRYFWREW